MDSDNDSDLGDILDDLLANSNDNEKSAPKRQLEELSYNFLDSQGNIVAPSVPEIGKKSEIHVGDADSSDEEDKKNFEQQKYTDCGRNLKSLLRKEDTPKNFEKLTKTPDKSSCTFKNLPKELDKLSRNVSQNSFDFNGAKKKSESKEQTTPVKDVYSDPIFGLRIVKPLISSAQLVDRMRGRKAVTISRVKNHLSSESTHDDWVIAGILINRSPTKTSQKGTQYCIWKLCDLSDKMNTVALFLFSGAYKLFWKTAPGVAVGILNPSIMDSKDDVDQATLSVDNGQKVMILGNSRDMGKCKSKKKNGEPCSNIVNLSTCEYCIYHVKQEYRKASNKRSDLQSNGSGGSNFSSSINQRTKTPLAGIYSQSLSNQKFTPIPAKRNEKLYEKDSARLALLRRTNSMPGLPVKIEDMEKKKKSCSVELTGSQMKKDLERLEKLRGWSVTKPMSLEKIEQSSSASSSPISNGKKSSKLEISALSGNSTIPRLGSGMRDGKIDFSQPITKRHIDKARKNALLWIKDNGGALKQSNPNKICESRDKKIDAGTKRRREIEDETADNEKKRKKALINDKFKEMMEAKSSHVDLVEKSLDEDKEKYFDKLEIKERMEEKMLTTYKIDCKAVKCLICKYTAYSGSDLCKQQKHPLRVVDAVKSFFKCHDCGNRTVSLDRIPSESCKKCRGSHWLRAPMMAEKRTDIPSIALSIRGGEEKFIGSVCQDSNINLLVPDSGTADS